MEQWYSFIGDCSCNYVLFCPTPEQKLKSESKSMAKCTVKKEIQPSDDDEDVWTAWKTKKLNGLQHMMNLYVNPIIPRDSKYRKIKNKGAGCISIRDICSM